MFRSHTILIVVAAVASVASGLAQEDEISIDSKVSPEQIKQWLQSSDSRKVAWGAYFAGKSDDVLNNDLYLEIMARRLALRVAPPVNQVNQNLDASSRISREAISEILDALLERNQSVPASSLTLVMSEFPIETFILAARLPDREAAPFFQSWYAKRSPPQDTGTLLYSNHASPFAAIAAMLLAKAPPAGFAASVLAESSERLLFRVADGMWQEPYTSGGSAGRCNSEDEEITLPPRAEEELSKWPPLFKYLLLQNAASPYAGTLLVEAGGERISYRRVSVLIRPSYCYGVEYFSEETRHHLLAEMLRADDKQMLWPAQQDVIYIQGSKEEFVPALTRQIELEESKFLATAKALRERGYLTLSEANTVRPKLVVTVNDVRSPVVGQDHFPPPLPKLEPTDSRTSINYDKR